MDHQSVLMDKCNIWPPTVKKCVTNQRGKNNLALFVGSLANRWKTFLLYLWFFTSTLLLRYSSSFSFSLYLAISFSYFSTLDAFSFHTSNSSRYDLADLASWDNSRFCGFEQTTLGKPVIFKFITVLILLTGPMKGPHEHNQPLISPISS